MDAIELLDMIKLGESSSVQFKERIDNAHSISQEMVAFSNTNGGIIIIGVNDKTGALNGLSFEEIRKTNQLLVNAACDNVKPAIIITTETILANSQSILIIKIKEGSSKPYKDKEGIIWIKNGPDKRRVFANEEMARLLQEGRYIYADEMPVPSTSLKDIDIALFKKFIENKLQQQVDADAFNPEQLLTNLNLLQSGELTVAGSLLFGKVPQIYRPLDSIQCVTTDALTLLSNNFIDSEPAFEGNIQELFTKAIAFLSRHIRKIQVEPSFNSLGVWEVPREVFEELIVNALLHRNYFTNSTVKIFVFPDRVEIISPGKLPNSLTVVNVANGVSIARNPVLRSFAQHILPYKGLGTGIRRALALYPDIELINDVLNDQFIVKIKLPARDFIIRR